MTAFIKYISLVLVSVFFCSLLHAQVDSVYTGAPVPSQKKIKKDNPTWDKLKDKLTFGANFQGWFGFNTFIYVAPTVGYQATKKLNVGVGFVYNYISADYGVYGTYKQSSYGGHSYARYLITNGLFAQVQYDKLRQPDFLSQTDPNAKTWVDYLLVGGGFHRSIGKKASFVTAIMYNLSPSILSIYYPNRLVIQLGFTVGF